MAITENGIETPKVNIQHNYTEAPASLTLKISYRGYNDMLFTLRDTSGIGLLDKLDRVLDRFERMGITPNNSKLASPIVANSGNAPMCPAHNRPMKQGQRGGWYCPEKIAENDGTGRPVYCKQKVN